VGPAGAALRDGCGPPPAPGRVPEVEGLSRVVAAFDLDRTLTRRDTLGPFLLRATGRAATGRAVVTLSLRLALGLTGDGRRDAAKEALLVRLLAGRDLATLSAVAEAFAGEVVASHLRPDTLARLEWHRAQDHHVVIVSAAPELYVAPLGRRLGVDVLATRLEVGSDGRLTGRLAGRNCRGAEKALRLREHLGPEPVTLLAYGDSRGDRELLAMAQTAVWVGRAPLPVPRTGPLAD
jgi:HAD superfamily hydrolase (TIGR01490 family)